MHMHIIAANGAANGAKGKKERESGYHGHGGVHASQYYGCGSGNSTFHKQSKMFEELILALTEPGRFEKLPGKTTFIFTEEDILQNTLLHIREKCPEMVKNRARFLSVVDKIVFGIHSL